MPKTVQLSDEAYGLLTALKRPGESYSDTVKRLAVGRKDPRGLLKLGPSWPGYDFDEVKRKMDEADRKRYEEIHGPLRKTKRS